MTPMKYIPFCLAALLAFATPARADELGPHAPALEKDRQRLEDVLALAEDIEAYHKKTHHYPLAPDIQDNMTVVGITDHLPQFPGANFTGWERLQDELRKELGKNVTLPRDPDDGKQDESWRLYQYATDGQDYYVSAFFESIIPYTRPQSAGHYKFEVSSRPSLRDSQYRPQDVRRLLKYGPDDAAQQNALTVALAARDFDAAKQAITDGANLAPICDFNVTCQPLAQYAEKGDIKTMKFLLDNGGDVDGFNAFYDVPLILALSHGHADAAEMLIKAGADVNAHNAFGATPFIGAVADGNVVAAKLMLDKGADVNMRYLAINSDAKPGDTGDRPLEAAIKSGKPEMVALLLKAGADANLKGQGNAAMLDLATGKGDKKIIALIKAALKK